MKPTIQNSAFLVRSPASLIGQDINSQPRPPVKPLQLHYVKELTPNLPDDVSLHLKAENSVAIAIIYNI